MLPSRCDLVTDEVAGADGPLLMDLQRGILPSAGKDVDQSVVEADGRRVEDTPVSYATKNSRKELGLLLPYRNGLVQELAKQLEQWFIEPRVERAAPDARSPVVHVSAQHVVLAASLVRAAREDQGDHELEHDELPLALLNAVLVCERTNARRIQRLQ
jgi:hypothetical protein